MHTETRTISPLLILGALMIAGVRFFAIQQSSTVCASHECPHPCGDGILSEGEYCDDGNLTNGDGCTADCHIEPYCGNGIVEDVEQCDDSNRTDNDGCNSSCEFDEDRTGGGSGNSGSTSSHDSADSDGDGHTQARRVVVNDQNYLPVSGKRDVQLFNTGPE